jgi:tetratricopeptide (TPR) repeat protein
VIESPQTPHAPAPGFARRAEDVHLRGDTEGALRLLSAGVRRHPDDVTARLVLARVCRDSGRDDEARDWLASALQADPECPAALLQFAELLGETADASHREKLAAQEPWDDGFRAALPHGIDAVSPGSIHGEALAGTGSAFQKTHVSTGVWPEPRAARKEPPPTFAFPVRDEEEEPEIEENSAPHIATVTLAEIYLQQGLKEQAAQIYRQLLERQPGDDSVRRRLQEIEGD